MQQHTLKYVNNCLNTNIYSYLEASGGQNSNLYLNVVHFSTPALIRHLLLQRTVVFLPTCQIRAAPFVVIQILKHFLVHTMISMGVSNSLVLV